MRNEDDANYYHNNGRGYPVGGTGTGIWINPDLTQAERLAEYEKRVAAKKKQNEGSQPNSLNATPAPSVNTTAGPATPAPVPAPQLPATTAPKNDY